MEKTLVLDRSRREIQFLQLAQAAQRLDTRAFDACAREHQPPQVQQTAETCEAPIRNGGETEVQFAQRGQFRERLEAGIAHVSGLQIQSLDVRQRFQISQLGIGDIRSGERNDLNV